MGAAYADLPSQRTEDFERAVACYLDSLRVHREYDHPEEWARTQNSLGNAYRNLASNEGGFERARGYFDAALRVYTEQTFPLDWALVQNNLGALYADATVGNRANNFRTAIHHIQCSLRIYTEADFPSRWAIAQGNLGAAYIQLKDVEPEAQMTPAINALRASLRALAPDIWPFDRLVVLQNLSTACYREQLWEDTLAVSIESIALLEDARSAALTEQERHRVLSQYSAMFERAVIACVELGRFKDALLYVERGKTRNLIDSLVRRDSKPRGVDSRDWKSHLDLLRERRYLEREMQSNDLASQNDSTRYRNRRDRLELVKNDLSNLEIRFREAAPDYLAVARPLDFAELLTIVQEMNSVLVEFRVTERGTYVFLIGKEDDNVTEEQVVHIPSFSTAALRRLLIGTDAAGEEGWLLMYDLWHHREVSQYQWMQCLKRIAASLYAQLLSPVLGRICKRYPNDDRLILVPNQRLHLLPLHAACQDTDGELHYLLDKYEVCYAPSCSVLRCCLDWNAMRRDRRSLFAVQNPQHDLAFADWDVEEAARHFERTCILAGNEANLSRVTDLVNLGHEVLFSCHGRYNVTDVWDSELVLQGQDRLKRAEMLELDLSQAWLVVLSACETNVTDYRDLMDEVQGIHTAFLMAGAPTVIGTLWSVNDLSTALLMKRFHENLYVRRMRRAEAIRAAQIWLRDLQLQEVEQLLAEKRTELVSVNAPKRVAAIDMIKAAHHLTDLAAANNGRPFAHPHWWAAFQCVGAP